MPKYIFQEGGETDDLYSSTSFFNNYLDALTANQQQVQDAIPVQEEKPVAEEESDYIKGLRAYDDEQSKSESDNNILDKIEQLLEQKLFETNKKRNEYDWFEDEDNQGQIAEVYNTQNMNNATYNENIAAGESGGNYFIQNPQPGQTAFGKYQFIKSTRQNVYKTSKELQNRYPTINDFEEAFKGNKGKAEAVFAQEKTMQEYTQKGEPIHHNNPIAKALYHYSPKFAQMYTQGQLNLDKRPSDYGVGKGVNNPTFRSFLKSHKIIS